ncbi:pyruvate formate-lyase-activating protein [Corynebacterium ulceribovis]|uniref:pyruvate formate-lyase-activating protein n=1 Tax=Corynebacterium ulceribovis TaxID=487732 RepID=UPI0003A1A7D9|nr:pyruvate formate-lyase-activating protein [Corynebacterium ulceribovis]
MADGVNTTVTISPGCGPRRRGNAQGLGVDDADDVEELSRSALLAARNTGEVGMVHSWELVTAVDGPGTRLTVFLSGCPLRCQYCHNPDTMRMLEGTVERASDIVAKAKRYRSVFRATGGGLTLSGGEPLFQIAFARRILAEVHAAGIHTTIDTSGFLGKRLSDEDLANVDLVLLDVKSGIPELYRDVTGGRNLQPTIDFGDRLNQLGKRVWVRFVLVPGLTDAPENIAAVADIVARWRSNVERVEVLPFHNMATDKWEHLGMAYRLRDTKPPTPESVAAAREVFRSRGLEVY